MLQTPRTLEYHILRVCERLHLTESKFLSYSYQDQLRLLAYDHLRCQEESAWLSATE